MTEPLDVAAGLAVRGASAVAAPVRAAVPLARLAGHAPLIGRPLRGLADSLAIDGAGARLRIEDELERAIDRALAGQLTDAVARSLGRHRVVERIASQVLNELDLERIVSAVLTDERTERLVVHVLESRLLDDLTERVLLSPEFQRVLEHVSSSPELLAAVTHHTETLAEEMVSDVRRRSQKVDDLAERTVRGWLRKPRPAPST